MFAGTGASEGKQIQFDAGSEMSITDGQGVRTGTFTMDEAKRELTVDIKGQQEVWKYSRSGMNLDITYPNNQTDTFTMQ